MTYLIVVWLQAYFERTNDVDNDENDNDKDCDDSLPGRQQIR